MLFVIHVPFVSQPLQRLCEHLWAYLREVILAHVILPELNGVEQSSFLLFFSILRLYKTLEFFLAVKLDLELDGSRPLELFLLGGLFADWLEHAFDLVSLFGQIDCLDVGFVNHGFASASIRHRFT